MFNAITDVENILVGHYTDLKNATGCTVILCPPQGVMGGVDVRGPAPATRETDLLKPSHLVNTVNAILLTGGSAFGLDAAGGVVRYLEEKNIGYDTRIARVPIVPAAAIFDLAIGNSQVRPDANAGYQACVAATSGAIAEGTVGAGTGALVGHLLGPQQTTKGGLGTASQKIKNEIIVGAIVVVNSFGDVIDPRTGVILAGTRKPSGDWLDSGHALKHGHEQTMLGRTNTTIGVIATNAALTKEDVNLVAMMAHDGLARAIRPAHALFDGDALFAVSTGKLGGDVSAIGHTASEVVAQAIVNAVNAATGLDGIPARKDL